MTAARLEVFDDSDALARAVADFVGLCARKAIADSGRFTFAVSGGRTPWAMFEHLTKDDVAWDLIDIYQVDERVAPTGDPDRNLTHLYESLPPQVTIHAMPVERADLDAASLLYANELPAQFDLIHLGLGPDGHTASLVPGDPALEVADRDVAVTGPYMGHRRMTLTYPVINRATEVLWLVAGADKADALRRLQVGDRSIPAGRVSAPSQVIFADRAATG